jgi:type III pantothenate kinase
VFLCIDVGNSQIHGGFYQDGLFVHSFRIQTRSGWSADQCGLFIRSFCHEKNINLRVLKKIAVSSVVPSMDVTIREACRSYFGIEPLYLKSGVKTGISVVRYKNVHEIGSDLIASAVGAVQAYPHTNLIVMDFGTATTIIAVNASKEFFAGPILPGVKTQVASLAAMAEKLVPVEVVVPQNLLVHSTAEAIQAGVYYSHLAALRYLSCEMASLAFNDPSYTRVATGGYSSLFEKDDLFDAMDPVLVLKGLVEIIRMND